MLVVIDLLYSVTARWDHRQGAALVQFRSQPVGIEGLVAQQGIEVKVLDEWSNPDHVVALTGQEHEAYEIAQSIDKGDNLGGQPAFRAPDGLMASPPFAPLAFW